MTPLTAFPKSILAQIDRSETIGIQAGSKPHAFLEIWAVTLGDRVFVRSYTQGERSWHKVFLRDPVGLLQLEGGELVRVQAEPVRDPALNEAVSRAYARKYDRGDTAPYVAAMTSEPAMATTLEMLP